MELQWTSWSLNHLESMYANPFHSKFLSRRIGISMNFPWALPRSRPRRRGSLRSNRRFHRRVLLPHQDGGKNIWQYLCLYCSSLFRSHKSQKISKVFKCSFQEKQITRPSRKFLTSHRKEPRNIYYVTPYENTSVNLGTTYIWPHEAIYCIS